MRQPLPVGFPVPARAAVLPAHVRLEGRIVELVPIEPARDAAALFGPTHGAGEHVWAYLADGPYATAAELEDALTRKADAPDAVFHAIVDRASRETRGYASFMRIDVPNRVVEVGNVLFAPALQGTTGATEAMYLMARHAFEDLGYRRYEWKCNDLNAPSRRAAVRFGFSYEGTFRQHMIVKGRNRDTAWYAMLDTEWPRVKAAFEAWLSPENFDEEGRQKRRLEEFSSRR
jgi:RimJ/RimL family protein N-acetyltransferase